MSATKIKNIFERAPLILLKILHIKVKGKYFLKNRKNGPAQIHNCWNEKIFFKKFRSFSKKVSKELWEEMPFIRRRHVIVSIERGRHAQGFFPKRAVCKKYPKTYEKKFSKKSEKPQNSYLDIWKGKKDENIFQKDRNFYL